jgi:hypothetical protein
VIVLIRIRGINVLVTCDSNIVIKQKIAKKLRININEIIDYKIHKKSIDARIKSNVLYVYELDVNLKNEKKVLNNPSVFSIPNEEYAAPLSGNTLLNKGIIIVGSGPAGLFAAYILVLNGYKVKIIERGENIENRVKSVLDFWQNNKLKLNSNVQFGEGGAGTFSDGKLNTLVNDKNNRIKKVLETFVKFGAPEDILYLQHPHIGTDILRKVIVNMRKEIIRLGGEFYFNTCLTDIIIKDNKVEKIIVNDKDFMECDALVLAIGHSARDTFKLLYEKGFDMSPKAFAVGVRIINNQESINNQQYGKFSKYLPPASYKLTYQTSKKRGVYSFCMCPGGYVVNASSEMGRLAINGMSNYKRESKNANSALVVTISPSDFGTNPLDGVEFQRKLEEKAYLLGNGSIPIETVNDYLKNELKEDVYKINPEIKGKYNMANLNLLFPEYINEALKEALIEFNKKINCFIDNDAVLCGVESRTSSPVRINRNDNLMSNIDGIYPCGEGAGYAGGITTSSVDGIKVAEEIIKKYHI